MTYNKNGKFWNHKNDTPASTNYKVLSEHYLAENGKITINNDQGNPVTKVYKLLINNQIQFHTSIFQYDLTNNWINLVNISGGSYSDIDITALHTLEENLYNFNLTNKITNLWPIVGNNLQTTKYPLIGNDILTSVSFLDSDYSRTTGIIGKTGGGYKTTYYPPGAGFLAVDILQAPVSGTGGYWPMGVSGGGGYWGLQDYTTPRMYSYYDPVNAYVSPGVSLPSLIGLWCFGRNSDKYNPLYINGTFYAARTTSSILNTSTKPLYLMGRNSLADGSMRNSFSDGGRCGLFATLVTDLTVTDHANLVTAINNFRTVLNRS